MKIMSVFITAIICSNFLLHARPHSAFTLSKTIPSLQRAKSAPTIFVTSIEAIDHSQAIPIPIAIASALPVCHSQSAPAALTSLMPHTRNNQRANEILPYSSSSSSGHEQAMSLTSKVAICINPQMSRVALQPTQVLERPQKARPSASTIAMNRAYRLMGHLQKNSNV